MQIVIDIPEETVNEIKDNALFAVPTSEILWDVTSAIINGTPLPKGHGNIYDENDIKKDIKNPYQCQTVLYGLELVKPIIEADTESEEQA